MLNFVGSAGAATTSVSAPNGAVGDLLIVFAWRNGITTAPTLPAGWTNIDNSGGSGSAFRAGWRLATGVSDTSDVWTNATHVEIQRWSGVNPATPVGAFGHNAASSGTSITYAAIGGATGIVLVGASAGEASFAGFSLATSCTTRPNFARDNTTGSAPMVISEHRMPSTISVIDTMTADTSTAYFSFHVEIIDWDAEVPFVLVAPGLNQTPPTSIAWGGTEDVIVSAPPDQTVSPTGFTSEAVGVVAVTTNYTVAPTAIDDHDQLGFVRLDLMVSPASLRVTEALGTPSVSTMYTVSPAAIDDRDQLGQPIVAQSLAPIGIDDRDAVGQVLVAQNPTPYGIQTAERFGQPVVSLIVAPAGIPTSETLGAVQLAQSTNPYGVDDRDAVGFPAVTTTYTVSPVGINDRDQLGNPGVGQLVSPAAIDDRDQLGNPLTSASYTITPSGIDDRDQLGVANVTQVVSPVGIQSSERVSPPSSVTIVVGINPYAMDDRDQVGFSRIDLQISPAGINDRDQVGTASAGLSVTPYGIDDRDRVGSPRLDQVVSPAGISTSENIGAPSYQMVISSTGIKSDERDGYAATSVVISPTGIDDRDRVGVITISVTISPASVPTGVVFGLAQAGRAVNAYGIQPAEGFGIPSSAQLANYKRLSFNAKSLDRYEQTENDDVPNEVGTNATLRREGGAQSTPYP